MEHMMPGSGLSSEAEPEGEEIHEQPSSPDSQPRIPPQGDDNTSTRPKIQIGPKVEEVVEISEPQIRARRSLEDSLGQSISESEPNAPPRPYIYPARYRRHEPKLSDYNDKNLRVTRYECAMTLYLLRSFAHLIFRWLTFFAILLGVGSVLLCYYFKLEADIPLNIIGSALLFPVSFSIPYIFGRRENALKDLADLKSAAVSIYLATREWAPTAHKRELSKKVKRILKDLLRNIAQFCAHKQEDLNGIYRCFDELFVALEELRTSDRWIQSVISRCYQYARFMMNDFERIRVMHDFRIPSAFRSFTIIFLTFGSFFMGPIFANVSKHYGLWSGIYGNILTSLLLITLQHIIHDNEDPFDNLGWDDLNIRLIEEAPLHMWKTRPWEEEHPPV